MEATAMSNLAAILANFKAIHEENEVLTEDLRKQDEERAFWKMWKPVKYDGRPTNCIMRDDNAVVRHGYNGGHCNCGGAFGNGIVNVWNNRDLHLASQY
jgi:hypothetical protein